MNYRHAFHAGSFADVIKHIVLTRILLYLQEKPAPFRVIDSHAGAGLYDLTGEEAARSGEWLTGIARMMQARFTDKALPLVAPYLDIVRAFNTRGRACRLSRLAADCPRAAAAAGPADGLRDRAQCAQAADRRAAPRHPGPRGRPRRLDRAVGFRAAKGAPRPGADRPVLRGQGRIRTAGGRLCAPPSGNGRPAAICSGIRSRAAAPPMRSPARSPARRSAVRPAGKCLRLEFSVAPQQAGRAARLDRAVDGQPALDAWPPNSRPSCPSWKSRSARAAPAGSGWRRPSPDQAASGGTYGRLEIRIARRQWAGNRIMLTPVGTGFTFRFREWLRRSDKA